ncbi:hypothetical protein I3842_06G004200 [Carya illinoinensis]|uniref:Uncharacterized protein n=1 Tax=Carya illinoinensis TaxID=32201 RepID=A0A922ESK8_CARIL|nr:hypothetical protein I3842_06G004200 [Carya illinoinensis]
MPNSSYKFKMTPLSRPTISIAWKHRIGAPKTTIKRRIFFEATMAPKTRSFKTPLLVQ